MVPGTPNRRCRACGSKRVCRSRFVSTGKNGQHVHRSSALRAGPLRAAPARRRRVGQSDGLCRAAGGPTAAQRRQAVASGPASNRPDALQLLEPEVPQQSAQHLVPAPNTLPVHNAPASLVADGIGDRAARTLPPADRRRHPPRFESRPAESQPADASKAENFLGSREWSGGAKPMSSMDPFHTGRPKLLGDGLHPAGGLQRFEVAALEWRVTDDQTAWLGLDCIVQHGLDQRGMGHQRVQFPAGTMLVQHPVRFEQDLGPGRDYVGQRIPGRRSLSRPVEACVLEQTPQRVQGDRRTCGGGEFRPRPRLAQAVVGPRARAYKDLIRFGELRVARTRGTIFRTPGVTR